MKQQILITQSTLPQSCKDVLEQRFETHRLYDVDDKNKLLSELAPTLTAIAGAGVSDMMMAQLPKLKMISSFGVGTDSVDTIAAKNRGIAVTNTPDVLNDAMAELTIGMMIGLSRKLAQADQFVRAGKWIAGSFPNQTELRGKTVGIVGLGRIGKEIAQRCLAMKMRIVYFGRNKQANQPYIHYDNLEAMAKDANWLVVITPGGKATQNLIDANILSALGPKGFLCNVARGSIVDEAALVGALVNNKIAGAALDAFAHEPHVPKQLLELENVLLSPHQGSATNETRFAMGQLVVDNLDAFFADEMLLTQVV